MHDVEYIKGGILARTPRAIAYMRDHGWLEDSRWANFFPSCGYDGSRLRQNLLREGFTLFDFETRQTYGAVQELEAPVSSGPTASPNGSLTECAAQPDRSDETMTTNPNFDTVPHREVQKGIAVLLLSDENFTWRSLSTIAERTGLTEDEAKVLLAEICARRDHTRRSVMYGLVDRVGA